MNTNNDYQNILNMLKYASNHMIKIDINKISIFINIFIRKLWLSDNFNNKNIITKIK